MLDIETMTDRTLKERKIEMWDSYKYIVGYGVGQYYETVKEELFQAVALTYLCDRKWDEVQPEEYDGILTISRRRLSDLENVLVVVMVGSRWIYEAIRKELESLGMAVVHVDEFLGVKKEIDGRMLKKDYPDGKYEDTRGNIIYFDQTLPDNIKILLVGCNSKLSIKRNLIINSLRIRLGNKGICLIGENTEIVGANLYVSNAKLSIGSDCLFSTEVLIRTHDGHHIFDLNTRKRINFAKDVFVGDNVWIGQRAHLLGGTRIGNGSLVGANAVTSGRFGEHQIIAGNPARCIRENICWSRDDTDYFDRTCLEECKSKDALKYL